MSSVWGNKPAHHEKVFNAFSNLHTIILILSSVNILIKGIAVYFLFMIVNGNK
jgi:hypothetical protein